MEIDQAKLTEAFTSWERKRREGKDRFRTPSECDALPVEQVAGEQAAHLWDLLTSAPVATTLMTV